MRRKEGQLPIIFIPPHPSLLPRFPIREERLVEMRRGRAEDEGLRLPEEVFAVVAQLHIHEGLFRFVLDHRGADIPAGALLFQQQVLLLV